jgi:hypothetical protein
MKSYKINENTELKNYSDNNTTIEYYNPKT